MNFISTGELKKYLLELDKTEVSLWLNKLSLGQVHLPKEVDDNWWSATAYLFMNRSESTKPWDLQWAKCSIFCYEYPQSHSLTSSAMMFRVRLMRELGIDRQENVLNPDHLVNWLIETTKITHELALEKSRTWVTDLANGDPFAHLSNDEVLELRTIKEKLNIVSGLLDLPGFQPSPELSSWLKLHRDLP